MTPRAGPTIRPRTEAEALALKGFRPADSSSAMYSYRDGEILLYKSRPRTPSGHTPLDRPWTARHREHGTLRGQSGQPRGFGEAVKCAVAALKAWR